MRHPSGEQYVIASGRSRATISEVGATLRTFTVEGLDVIDGFTIDERSTDGRGQVLAPWPNRLTDGRYTYGGHECQAPLNEPARHDAIHGLVRWLDWSVVSRRSDQVSLSCVIRPQPAYEWQLDLEVTYTVADSELTTTFVALNVDREQAPFGVGFHPYLTVGTPLVDHVDLTVPAIAFLDPEVPAETPRMVPVSGTAKDFTRPRSIASTELDTAFGELARGDDGRAVARLEAPGDGRWIELWVDEGYPYLMVYTADQVASADRRRAGVAIEPMSCLPDAFRSGLDLIELAPGASWRASWGLRVSAR
ncbi:aldose 1-epimerase family protein [Microbacterium deminutum]|uniref:Aldose 1-epimerase family protein n=1 Tax=Microbacterium deminutum TaxID=344164 RepID=A0ABP5BW47_9MICO